MRGSNRQRAFAAAAAVLLGAGYAGVGYGAPAGPTDTTPPPETTPAPTPDPAPPPPRPKPAPKPAAKPAPKPAPKPAQVYHAPVRHSTPTPTQSPQPVYKRAPVVHHVTTKRARHARRHKSPHRRAKPVVTTPRAHAQVKHASVVRITGVPTAAVAPSGSDDLRRTIVIAAVGLAALLFLLVLAVPATAARFTPPGRVLMDHQIDLVLVGAALLLLTALLFAITGTG